MTTGYISLRFRHPTRELDYLSSLLGLTCFRSWTVGTARQTPTGKILPGTNAESYWVSLSEYPVEAGFSNELKATITRLVQVKDHIRDIKKSGGKVEIYLQLSGSITNGDSIDSTLLKKMGELEVDLLLEVFLDVCEKD